MTTTVYECQSCGYGTRVTAPKPTATSPAICGRCGGTTFVTRAA